MNTLIFHIKVVQKAKKYDVVFFTEIQKSKSVEMEQDSYYTLMTATTYDDAVKFVYEKGNCIKSKYFTVTVKDQDKTDWLIFRPREEVFRRLYEGLKA